jgi:ABC-type transport system substrate-binding protein
MMESPNALANPSLLTSKPMGSGPYQLTSVSSALTYNFDRFPNYWDKSHQYPAHLVLTNSTNQTTMLNAVQTGQTDASNISPAVLPQAKADKNLQFATYPSFAAQVIFMNNKVAPLNNASVREAVSLALDRQAFNAADDGQCYPLSQAFVPGMVGYVPSLTPTTDVAKAKQLIQQAGATGASITMLTIPNLPYLTWAEVAQAQLDAVGLNVKLDVQPGTVYRTLYLQGGYGMLAATPNVSAFDPSLIITQYVLGYPGTKDPALTSEINSALQLPLGTSQRNTAFQQINTDLTTKYYPWVSMCVPIYTFAANKKLVNLNTMQYGFTAQPVITQLQKTS